MMRRKVQAALGIGAAVLLLGACGTEQVSQPEQNGDSNAVVTVTVKPTPDVQPTEAVVTPEATKVPELPFFTSIKVEAGTTIDVLDFFSSETEQVIETEVTVERELTEQELRQAGASYEVPVTYKGQTVTVTVEIEDTTPPVIGGAEDITVIAGEQISYKKGIELTDNADGEITLTVEKDAVNLEKEGEYPVRYVAEDASGNVTEKEITVFVKELSDKEAKVSELADALIEELITEDMSKWDTCYKLWNWCRTKIKYAYSKGDRSSVYAGAYEGLNNRSGDCYAYYATFTILLEKCGIETMEVRRTGGTSDHWWNLVNLGDGWYHCDSSPRKKGDSYRCFMQTDAQVQAYTESYTERPNYYTFDETLLPERETKIVYGE